MARQLKKRGIPVVYFVSPQVWAWRKGRVKTLKQRIAKMIVIFDFEEEIYKQAGVPVEYVGHPLVDMVRPHHDARGVFRKAGLGPLRHRPSPCCRAAAKRKWRQILPSCWMLPMRLARERKLQFVIAVAPTIDPQWLETHC